jgi:tRNA(adenine34) deaminase
MLVEEQHQHYMRRALELADVAYSKGEIPIGAVVVYQDNIIGEGYNQTITSLDPSAHAEMVAIREAAKTIGNYRLVDCRLYVTIEPCSMCTGLLVHSRISELVFGAVEPKAGAIYSASNVSEQAYFNHRFTVTSDILAEQCSDIMSRFFKERRKHKKALRQSSHSSKEP